MIDIDYGYVHIKLAELMEKQNISISRLAFRSETQRTQLKAYIRNDIQRLDTAVLARLWHPFHYFSPHLSSENVCSMTVRHRFSVHLPPLSEMGKG